MKVLLCLILLTCIVAIQANLRVVPCSNARRGAIVKKFELHGCHDYPCKLPRGKNSTLKLEFQALHRINSLKLKIAGIIGGKEVPFSVNDRDHCNTSILGGKCPLVKNTNYQYRFSLPVLAQYPKVSVVIKYEVVDHAGRSVMCFTFPAQIV